MNIGDIAEMAGVSRAAVSRYLNDGYVSEEKKERIRRAIEETGFVPSYKAQTLRTGKTRLIGVILPRINSDSISSITAGIGSILREEGYDMLLAVTDNNPGKELDFLRIFTNDRVDGIILVATVFTREHKKILRSCPVPVVIVGQKLSGVTSIYHEDKKAGREITGVIISRGRKNIGYLGVLMEDAAVGRDRLLGFIQAHENAGLPFRGEMTAIADFSIESGYEVMKSFLTEHPDADGMVCATDRIAIGAIRALKEAGRNVPEDVCVAGFGDNIISGVAVPSITTVHFYYRESGIKAAEKILEQIRGEAPPGENIRLGYQLLVRDST